MSDISVYIALFSLIMAIGALIFAVLSPNSIKASLLAENAGIKVVTNNQKVEIDALRRDVDAFNRDTFKKLGDKINLLEVDIHGLANQIEKSETARKNWGNKWGPLLGKVAKNVEDGDEEIDSEPDKIKIPDDVIQPGSFATSEPIETPKGFASLMG